MLTHVFGLFITRHPGGVTYVVFTLTEICLMSNGAIGEIRSKLVTLLKVQYVRLNAIKRPESVLHTMFMLIPVSCCLT